MLAKNAVLWDSFGLERRWTRRPALTFHARNRAMATRPIPELTAKDIARFWAKVDVRGPDECWPWTGHLNDRGYGSFAIGGALFKSHRIALAIDGRNPLDKHCCHRCDNPPCCNPKHLFSATNAENAADRDNKNRLGPRTGLHNGRAKLTDNDVRAIRTDTREHRIIAADYGVHNTQVCRIKRGLLWGHVQ